MRTIALIAALFAAPAVAQDDEPRSLDPEFMPCTVLPLAMSTPEALEREHYLMVVGLVWGASVALDGEFADPMSVLAKASEVCAADQTQTVWAVLTQTLESMRAN